MPNFADAGALAEDPDFRRRVTVALVIAAGTVATEDRSSYPDTRMFALRSALAQNVLQDPPTWGGRFAWILQYDQRVRDSATSGDGTTPAPVSDTLLAQLIYWVWNAVSGAGPSLIVAPVEPVTLESGQPQTGVEGFRP